MIRYITLAVFILLTHKAISQEFVREYGKVSAADFDLKKVNFDPDAEAVVIFDKAKSSFQRKEHGYNVILERVQRIKILEEAGMKYGEIEIPFYREGDIFEKIYDLEAITYNYEKGILRRTELKPENIYDEKLSESWMVRKFAMPDLKPGSIIEVQYKIESQYKFNLRDWYFQREIPTIYSEYITRMIPFYEYTFILQGREKFDLWTSEEDFRNERVYGNITFRDMVHRFVMNNIPGFQDEEFISTREDYLVKVDFQLSKVTQPDGSSRNIRTTWPEMIKDLSTHESFGRFTGKCEKMAKKDLLPFLNSSGDMEKFNEVCNYVKSNYKWNGGRDKYASKSYKEFISAKEGNIANINLCLTACLNAAGIEAYPVLLSTRDHGKVQYDYPFSSFLNYVIVAAFIDGKIILTDASQVLAPNTMIPPYTLNDKGLVVKKDEEIWISLVYPYVSRLKYDVNLDLEKDLSSYRAEIKMTAKEYDALNLRKVFAGDEAELIEYLEEKGNFRDVQVNEVENLNDPDKQFKAVYVVEDDVDKVGDKIYISPFIAGIISENPMKQKKRKYPVDMNYPKIREFHSFINIPEGYKVEYVPEGKNISNGLIELRFQAEQRDSSVQLSFTYYFKKNTYPAADYLRLKLWYEDIVNLMNDKVVLVKKQED